MILQQTIRTLVRYIEDDITRPYVRNYYPHADKKLSYRQNAKARRRSSFRTIFTQGPVKIPPKNPTPIPGPSVFRSFFLVRSKLYLHTSCMHACTCADFRTVRHEATVFRVPYVSTCALHESSLSTAYMHAHNHPCCSVKKNSLICFSVHRYRQRTARWTDALCLSASCMRDRARYDCEFRRSQDRWSDCFPMLMKREYRRAMRTVERGPMGFYFVRRAQRR